MDQLQPNSRVGDLESHDMARMGVGATSMNESCKHYAVDLSAYFDGELDASGTERIEAHLADCAGCRDTLARLGKLRGALRNLSKPTGRERRSILDDLKARMRDEEPDEPAASKDKRLPC